MTREDLYNSDRKEREKYLSAGCDAKIKVPITKDGFEALVEAATKLYDIPVDDGLRSIAAGYIHHIPADECTLTLKELGIALFKTISNNMTYGIDQEVKAKQLKASQELAEKDNVTPIKES